MDESPRQFPAHGSLESCHAATTKETPASTPRRPGILVVDDEEAVRGMLEVGLRHHGFAVWQAGNGQEAIQTYQQNRSEIDAVLLDVRMPDLDGPHTLAALMLLNPHVRYCFMTGQAGSYTQEQLLALGAAHVFQKPFQLARVAQALANLVGIP